MSERSEHAAFVQDACPRCGADDYTYLDYGGCSVCRPHEERVDEDELCDFVPTPEMRGEVPTAANPCDWPESGLPHGEHPLTAFDLESILDTWVDRLNLRHWNIYIKYDEVPDSDCADYSVHDYHDEGFIRIVPEFVEWDRREANLTIVHELLHFLHRDMAVTVNSVESRMDDGLYNYFRECYDGNVEGFIERLANILVNLGGAV